LKFSLEERATLYYNKHKYRVAISEKCLRHVYYAKSLRGFKKSLAEYIKYVEESPFATDRDFSLTQKQYRKISKIIKFRNNFAKLENTSIRHYNDTMSFYCDDPTFFDPIKEFSPDATITEVKLLPSGIKYFSKEPKNKYRLFFKNKQVDAITISDLIEYFNKNKDITPSKSLSGWLFYQSQTYYYKYIRDCFFIDYNDESTLTIMHLLFTGIIGKSFKLEKRPS